MTITPLCHAAFVLAVLAVSASGCIRFSGGGFYTQTPEEQKTYVVGVDTGKMLDSQRTQGSVTT